MRIIYQPENTLHPWRVTMGWMRWEPTIRVKSWCMDNLGPVKEGKWRFDSGNGNFIFKEQEDAVLFWMSWEGFHAQT